MNCVYVRQTSEFSAMEYLSGPEEFSRIPDELHNYKNIVFLTNPGSEKNKLHVHSVGFEIADPKKNLINRVFQHTIALHYVVGGKGFFNNIPVKQGDCFVAFRNTSHSIRADPDDPLQFYWILVWQPQDQNVEDWGLTLSNPLFPYDFEMEMQKIFEGMLHFREGKADVHYFYLGKFFELMAFHRAAAPKNNSRSRSHAYDNYVAIAKRMWEETSYRLSVEDVAHSLGFSRKHFSLFFTEKAGMLPQQYLLEQKIESAKLRMQAGESSIKNLAFQLGYSDYPSFSRAFKKQTGQSPHEYLAQVKKK